jgi:hypothetical protein
MKWVEDLKKFNAGKEPWCIPRKGTREYKEVLSIMTGGNLVYKHTIRKGKTGKKD